MRQSVGSESVGKAGSKNPIHQELNADLEMRASSLHNMSQKRASFRTGAVTELGVLDVDLKTEWRKIRMWKLLLYYLGVLCSAGTLFVVCINRPLLRLNFITSQCSMEDATLVKITYPDHAYDFSEVEKSEVTEDAIFSFEVGIDRYFASRRQTGGEVKKIMDEPENFSDVFVVGDPSKWPSREYVSAIYGLNRLRLPVADPFAVVVVEMLAPFYLFQYFAVAVWIYTLYYAYSTIVMFITIMSIYFVCQDKLYNIKRLHDLADTNGTVQRTDKTGAEGMESGVPDSALVPSDCFFVTENMVMPVDAILLSGKVVIDEAMLTGESVPITKTPFVKSSIDTDATKRKANILYCGTRVCSIGNGARPVAMTYRTGFRSAKGSIVGTLVKPPVEIVSFMPDALRAILFMVVITTAIFGWSASELLRLGTSDHDIFVSYLTALTIAVPPGLVACLSIATSVSVVRLSQMKISISDTSKLNAAGYVSVACFDKTGTLTDENILYQGRTLFENGIANDGPRQQEIATQVMATCHSLSVLNGKLVGDQLEVELLQASGWSIISPMDSKYLLATAPNQGSVGKPHTILRHFEFSPDKLRAGTVLVNADGKSIFLLKGSPETIIGLCAPGSVPPNIQNEIAHLTHKGYRVIGIAFREVFPADDYAAAAPQSELESADLKFLGLIYFSNKLKPDTWPATITGLQNADIQVNMITGDHISTAIAISTECHILPVKRQLYIVDADSSGALLIVNDNTDSNETRSLAQILDEYEKESRSETPVRLAVTGQALLALEKEVDPALFLRLLKSACVFARTKPFQKKQIVTELKHPKTPDGPMTYVLFCGDGANDMEALASATVGVSLCDTATTVAASIVSVTQSPLSTVTVLREGRCSLVTAYVLVLYNIMYAIIQLFMTCYLNNLGLVFGDNMYIIQDLFYSLFLGLCISYTPPDDVLSVKQPPKRLFTYGLMAKLFVQLGIFPAFQAITLEILYAQKWFTKFDPGDDPLTESYAVEGSVLQILSLAQLMIASVVVTIGQPFRKPWYTNKAHWFVMSLQFAFIIYLLFGKDNEFMHEITNVPTPDRFGGILIGIIAANIFISAVCTKIADCFFSFD